MAKLAECMTKLPIRVCEERAQKLRLIPLCHALFHRRYIS
jgi:hypothetical protein